MIFGFNDMISPQQIAEWTEDAMQTDVDSIGSQDLSPW